MQSQTCPRLSTIFREKYRIINVLSRSTNFHPPLKTPKKYVLFRSFHLCYAQCIKHK